MRIPASIWARILVKAATQEPSLLLLELCNTFAAPSRSAYYHFGEHWGMPECVAFNRFNQASSCPWAASEKRSLS